jgi:hypothetical protein
MHGICFLPECKAVIRFEKEPEITVWPRSMALLPVKFIDDELSFTHRDAKHFVGLIRLPAAGFLN